jgi:hypothetical protein
VSWTRTSTVDAPPADPIGEVVAEAMAQLLVGSSVRLIYSPARAGAPGIDTTASGVTAASGAGPVGWRSTMEVRLDERLARLVPDTGPSPLGELAAALPVAGQRTAARFRSLGEQDEPVTPSVRRAVRDTLAIELLTSYLRARLAVAPGSTLTADIIDYLIGLSGTRVEAHDISHGVVVTDLPGDPPCLIVYPDDVRAAKRAPLLFDGERSVLVVDASGRARTELQRHRLDRSPANRSRRQPDAFSGTGALVGEATRRLGGLGFLLRADRTIWTYVDGQPLLVRRGDHWTAYPLELAVSIGDMIGGGEVAELIVGAAFEISARPIGAILAVVADAADLAPVVSPKDRYDLRHVSDGEGERPEVKLHHLIDADPLDHETLVRLAGLDGATIVDLDGRLLAYGAIVTSADSQHEGARTAAARTLSYTAEIVLKVSIDGDITIFRAGEAVTTLLGQRR